MNNRSKRSNLAFRARSLLKASTSSPAPAVAPKDQMATDAFLSSLAELRSMPHTHVSEKPVGRAEKPNDFGVLVTLNIPESKRKQKKATPHHWASRAASSSVQLPRFPRHISWPRKFQFAVPRAAVRLRSQYWWRLNAELTAMPSPLKHAPSRGSPRPER